MKKRDTKKQSKRSEKKKTHNRQWVDFSGSGIIFADEKGVEKASQKAFRLHGYGFYIEPPKSNLHVC